MDEKFGIYIDKINIFKWKPELLDRGDTFKLTYSSSHNGCYKLICYFKDYEDENIYDTSKIVIGTLDDLMNMQLETNKEKKLFKLYGECLKEVIMNTISETKNK